ncbi:MAG: class I SAM-dependent methyltransferase [Alphaproteobacteria bacterium]
MAQADNQSTAERLLALWDHLSIRRAHIAAQMPGDVVELAVRHPDRLGGIVLCAPSRLDPAPFAALADRLMTIAGTAGPTHAATAPAAARLPGLRRAVLDGYAPQGWDDVVRDRTDAIATAMTDFLGSRTADVPVPAGAARDGVCAGITYRIRGSGPALVLFPFFLAPSQWDPALALLERHFTVILLGGRHLGGVAALEDRAQAPTYGAMFRTLLHLLDPPPGARILDVGCGAGSLDRMLARRLGDARIDAVDANRFLLREAAALAAADGLTDRIAFTEGNAEALAFADATFDCAFSVTVLEECDADRAIAELVRVVKPGGRVGVIVRATDMAQWWNLDVPQGMRDRIDTPPQSVSPGGVADKGLYGRMAAGGLRDLTCFPFLVTLDNPGGPIWRHREDHVLAQFDAAETAAWQAARSAAAADGLLFMAHPMHCAVGTRP